MEAARRDLSWEPALGTAAGLKDAYENDFALKLKDGALPNDFECDDMVLSKVRGSSSSAPVAEEKAPAGKKKAPAGKKKKAAADKKKAPAAEKAAPAEEKAPAAEADDDELVDGRMVADPLGTLINAVFE